jgi:hypothetical protein
MFLDTIALPADLNWSNEFNWSPIKAQQEYSLGGTLIVQQNQVTQGRSIVLESGDDVAWVQRDKILAIKSKLDTLGSPAMTLALADGRSYNVTFDWSTGEPFAATPLLPGKAPALTDYYKIVLKLIQV